MFEVSSIGRFRPRQPPSWLTRADDLTFSPFLQNLGESKLLPLLLLLRLLLWLRLHLLLLLRVFFF
jgi:hypothetical protein